MGARIDWTKLLEDLAYVLGQPTQGNPDLRLPCSTYDLSKELNVARGTLRGWIDGAEPRHSDGEFLLDRWATLTGKGKAFAPKA